MDNITLKVAKDFSTTPGPRKPNEGKNSGETFRTEVLYPKMLDAISENVTLIVDLDGVAGYGTSFLEESFGGLIRVNNMSYDDIMNHLEIVSIEEPYLVEDIIEYLKDAAEHSE